MSSVSAVTECWSIFGVQDLTVVATIGSQVCGEFGEDFSWGTAVEGFSGTLIEFRLHAPKICGGMNTEIAALGAKLP